MFIDDEANTGEEDMSAGRGGWGRNEMNSVHFDVARLPTRGVDALRTAPGEAC